MVAAAFLAGSAAAQLVPKPPLPQAPVPAQSTLTRALPPLQLPKAPQASVLGTKAPVLGTGPLKPNSVLSSTTLPLPRVPLGTIAGDLASTLPLSLPQTSTLLPGQLAPIDSTSLHLSLPSLSNEQSLAIAAALEAARKRRLEELLRAEAPVLEADDQGNPVVRGKLLLLDADEAMLRRLTSAGFAVIAQFTDPRLGLRLTELAVPAGLSASSALRRLRAIAPAAQADYDHIFQPAGGALGPARSRPARGRGSGRLLIGMVDGGVASHASLARVSVEQRAFSGVLEPTAHGTAVASLLAGSHGAFRGAAQGASLAVADVYGGRRAAGSASTIVRALGWLVSKRPSVINISLVGPPNRLLGAAVKGVRARNIQVVAAVGNDGPAAPPQYPASYPGVLAITGVDARGRVLVEAGNASEIDFAAPGAQMAAARPGDGYARVRGTSFAAPLAAGRLALLGSVQRLSAEARPASGRAGRGIVCGSCRIDPARVGAK